MADADPRPIPTPYRALSTAGRGLAIVGAWGTALVVAVVAFPAGSYRGEYELIGFGLGFGIASAVAGVVALAVGGRRRLAIEAATAIVVAVLIAVGVLVGMLWVVPFATQRFLRYGSQEVRFYRGFLAAIVRDFLVRPRFPTAPVFGVVAGAIGGGLMRLGRRRPRLAATLAVGGLVALASSASLVSRLVADFALESRRRAWFFPEGGLNPIEVAGTIGAVAGSVVGAVAACGSLRGRRMARDGINAPPAKL